MSIKAGEIAARRQSLVNGAMKRFAEIQGGVPVTREVLERMKDELLQLARHAELFVTDEFQPAQRGTFKDFAAYKLNTDDGSERALYVSLALPGKESPPHNHKNWAILVGLKGVEENRLYEVPPEGGFRRVDSIRVGPGVGVALMPEDIHSIHVEGVGDEPVWQLRFYDRALELQTDRTQFDPETGASSYFPPNPNVKAVAV